MTQLPESSLLFELLEFVGLLVLVLGVIMVAWLSITYESPDHSRREDRGDKKY